MATNTQNTALLIMDMQVGIVAMIPGQSDTLVAKSAKAIAFARENNIPIIYVVVGFRPGAPEISLNNKGFGSRKEALASLDMTQFMQIHPQLAPKDGEPIVIKRRVSAFTGSDLEVILRAHGTQHLVLAGISTGGVVLSTLREASDKDYRLTVLSDCCVDPEPEIHEMLMTKIFSKQAEVITSDDWIS